MGDRRRPASQPVRPARQSLRRLRLHPGELHLRLLLHQQLVNADICDAVFDFCICRLDAGHEGPHACGEKTCLPGKVCQGQWTGSDPDGDPVPIVFPTGQTIEDFLENGPDYTALASLIDAMLPTRTRVPTQPPTTVDMTVLVNQEHPDTREQAQIRPEPRPEPVPRAAEVVETEYMP